MRTQTLDEALPGFSIDLTVLTRGSRSRLPFDIHILSSVSHRL